MKTHLTVFFVPLIIALARLTVNQPARIFRRLTPP